MATATSSLNTDDCESCTFCQTKHNRTRPSFCQCKHCSIPLCLECMKEHHDELLQDVAQISHQYNELQELLQTKQMMIVDETTRSVEHVNQYFDTYINELRDTQQKIIENMERAKQDAQNYLLKVNSDLSIFGGEIQGLTKESVVQMKKTKNLSTELKKIEQQLQTYQVTKTENLIATKPDFSIQFDCPPIDTEIPHSAATKINETCQKDPQEPLLKASTLSILDQPSTVPKYPTNEPQEKNQQNKWEDLSMSGDDDDTDTYDNQVVTSYAVDRMASDGRYILYTSYYDEGSDRIACCSVDDVDNNGIADKYRDWNQSRIVDMIWWNIVGKFVCATDDGVYTVEDINTRFKIISVISGKWSYIRVAANTRELFVWTNSVENGFNGIQIYSTQFKYIRTIDFNTRSIASFDNNSASFCVTDNLIASICTRNRNNREVFQVTFCDMNMNKFNSILLGECNGNIEIRTDGEDQFFITTGRRRFYIIRANGAKQMIKLENDGDCIGVLNNRRIVISNRRNNMELVTY